MLRPAHSVGQLEQSRGFQTLKRLATAQAALLNIHQIRTSRNISEMEHTMELS
jgi:hypothetical protein